MCSESWYRGSADQRNAWWNALWNVFGNALWKVGRSGCLGLAIGLVFWLGLSGGAQAENYTKEFLAGMDFSGRDLTNFSFTKANCREANFSRADLRGVSFFAANLEAANLSGANLSNSTLDTARLSQADLTNAILEGAFAFNAKFEGAKIEGADFTDVQLREDAQELLCKLATGVNPVTGRETRETLYCDY